MPTSPRTGAPMPKLPQPLRYFAWLCGLAILSACSGLPPQSSGAPSFSTGARIAGSSSGDLLYAAYKHFIEIYTYPGGVLETTVKTAVSVVGMCSDSTGNVYVAGTAHSASGGPAGVVEVYARKGTSPLASLNLPHGRLPLACSSDPTTGNLAVTEYNARTFTPSVAIFANAGGNPKIYASRALGAYPQPAYDDSGNLFVTSGGNLGALLATGKTSFEKITLDRTLPDVEHLQWDGKYFALQTFLPLKHQGERLFERVYRAQISGTSAKLVGMTRFYGWPVKNPGQSWIADNAIVGTPNVQITIWNYPQGGKAIKVIRPAHVAKAVTVSLAR